MFKVLYSHFKLEISNFYQREYQRPNPFHHKWLEAAWRICYIDLRGDYYSSSFHVNSKVTCANDGQMSVVNGTNVFLTDTICHERELGTKTHIERLFTSIRLRILDSSFIYLVIDIGPLLLTMQDVPQIYRSKWDTCPRWELRILWLKTLFSFYLLFFTAL